MQNALERDVSTERAALAEDRARLLAQTEQTNEERDAALASAASEKTKREVVERELGSIHNTLAAAEVAAMQAARESSNLQRAVLTVTQVRCCRHARSRSETRCQPRPVQEDAHARKRLAIRSYQLREHLVRAKMDLRESRQQVRKCFANGSLRCQALVEAAVPEEPLTEDEQARPSSLNVRFHPGIRSTEVAPPQMDLKQENALLKAELEKLHEALSAKAALGTRCANPGSTAKRELWHR